MSENPNRRQVLTIGAALAATGLTLGSTQPAAAHQSQPAPGDDGLDIAFMVFDGIVPLDLIGPLGVLSAAMRAGARPARLHFVAADLAPISGGDGLQLLPSATFDTLRRPHVLVVPGPGQPSRLLDNRPILNYIRAVHPHTQLTFGVCTGVLLLGAAGILRGRAATTYWAFTEELALFGARFQPRRWVADGKIVTSAGISAGIDAALAAAARLWGERATGMGQAFLEYDPDPPFDYGTVDKLPSEDADTLRRLFLAERERIQDLVT